MSRSLLVLAVVCAFASGAAAQTATVTGTVVDPSGAVVPGASVVLTGQGSTADTTTGAQGDYVFRNVAAGTYRIRVTLSGFAPATRPDVIVGGGNLTVPAIAIDLASLNDTVVVSASKSESALIDAPATMSVVTSAVLASTPAQNYGDLLRSVPGVNVIQLSARDVNVTNRQGTSTLSNSQLVLLDDRSIYLDFFGLVLWDFLPTNLSDIKQIEVIRGPASAVWGANALTGVVNVITKSPREAPGTTVSFTGGVFDRDAGSTTGKGMGTIFGANASFAQAPSAKLSYRVSAGYFNSDPLPRPVGQIPLIQDPRDPTATIGGAQYPLDANGAPGTSFQNTGTSQPKFDARLDQEINGGRDYLPGRRRRFVRHHPYRHRSVRYSAGVVFRLRQGELPAESAEGERLQQLHQCRSAQPAARGPDHAEAAAAQLLDPDLRRRGGRLDRRRHEADR